MALKEIKPKFGLDDSIKDQISRYCHQNKFSIHKIDFWIHKDWNERIAKNKPHKRMFLMMEINHCNQL